ncbi:amidohydrolase [Bacillus rubiinfantis]|uniref:amidohydrolase n=1 Tax=Bacillus rubiinfantis TaxID=1499680 RepID=UPI0005A97119|nr:amidohydrolase family protein [Bacillus rubiinfantis]
MTTNQTTATIVLTSNVIFTSTQDEPFTGYIAIRDNKIVAVGRQPEQQQWIGQDTLVYDLGDKLVMPGVHDNHVFFTGYMSMHRGVDLSQTATVEEALSRLREQAPYLKPTENLYAYGWNQATWGRNPEQHLLDEAFPDRPVIAINSTKSHCWMNQRAIDKYQFTPDHCSAEARALLLKDMLAEKQKVKEEFLQFADLLAARGVTSIRDIGFDEYDVLPVLTELAQDNELPLRVTFSLEPVLEPMNLPAAKTYQARYQDDHLTFHGFKIMIDGVVCDHTGDMLEPYADMPGVTSLQEVDYEKIEKAVQQADEAGIPCCLTAEGDAAIRQAVSIIEKCRQQHPDHKVRHSLSDLEFPHPDDIKMMGELEIFAEVYAQVLLLNPSYQEAYMAEVVGKDKEHRFYDYRSMLDAGVTITAGTDLPLFITSVPESIYAASKRLFPDGSPEGGWFPERGLPVAELLKAWTLNPAKHHGMEDKIGSLEAGKFADIAVFDRNLFTADEAELREAQVVLTITDGKIVHDLVNQ